MTSREAKRQSRYWLDWRYEGRDYLVTYHIERAEKPSWSYPGSPQRVSIREIVDYATEESVCDEDLEYEALRAVLSDLVREE